MMTSKYIDIENKEICAKCGGKCCSNMPGCSLPQDFGAPNQNIMRLKLREAFSSGNWAVDWWEGDPRKRPPTNKKVAVGYYVRPATKNKKYVLKDPSWGGECIFLTQGGCSLELINRPTNCRCLVPADNGNGCKSPLSKRDGAVAWIKYQPLLLEIMEAVEGEEQCPLTGTKPFRT